MHGSLKSGTKYNLLNRKVDIEDTEEALARYRRTKEKERMEMMQRKVRDKEEFNNMIGA